MRNIKYFVLIIFLCLYSCKEPIANFSEPQPKGKKDINQFSKKILGHYKNPEFDYVLTIESNLIFRTFYNIDTIASNEFNEQKEMKLLSKLSDSLYQVEINFIDTLFSFKNGDVLRKLNQNYFLNVKNSDEKWNVSKLNFKHNYLTLSQIFDINEIELLNTISNQTAVDSVYPKTYHLSKKQFKEFVKKNGFKESEVYIKQ